MNLAEFFAGLREEAALQAKSLKDLLMRSPQSRVRSQHTKTHRGAHHQKKFGRQRSWRSRR